MAGLTSLEEEAKTFREAAKDFANHIRGLLGFGPVDHVYPGKPGDGWSCPITNTIYNDTPEIRDEYMVFTGGNWAFVFKKPDVEYEWRDQYGSKAPFTLRDADWMHDKPFMTSAWDWVNEKLRVGPGENDFIYPLHKVDLTDQARNFIASFDERETREGYEWDDLVLAGYKDEYDED